VREYSMLLHNIFLQDNVNDAWRWLLDPSNGYSVWGAYRFLTDSGELVDRSLVDDIWHQHIPSKVSLFVWRLLRDRLPTKANLVRRHVLHHDGAVWVSGCGNLETAAHLFLACDIFSSLWSHVWLWLGISSVSSGDLRQHFIQFTNMAGLPRSTHLYFRIIWFASVWVLWKEMNDRIFKNMGSNTSTLLTKVKLNSFLWLKSKQGLFSYSYHDWWNHPFLCMGIHFKFYFSILLFWWCFSLFCTLFL